MRLQLLAATAMLSCIALSCSLSKEQTDLDGVVIAPSFKSESICHESEDFVSMSDRNRRSMICDFLNALATN